jgi:uncharacterized protein (UPF0332 family)
MLDYLQRAYDSVRAAKLLSSGGHYGFASSRACYAMFYAAEAFLPSGNLSAATHAEVIAEFGRKLPLSDQIPRHFHRYLIDAEAARIQADEEPTDSLTQADAGRHITHAEEFIETAERLLSPQ